MRIGRRSPSRLHALRLVLGCSLLAVVTFRAFFPSHAWFGGRGARRSPLVGSSSASLVAVSTRLSLAALTRQSSGTPVKRLLSEHSAPRGAPYFHVSPPHIHVIARLILRSSPSASVCNARRSWVAALRARRSPFYAASRPVVFFACGLCGRFSLRCPTHLGRSVSSSACAYSDSFGVGAGSTGAFRFHFTVLASKHHRKNSAFFNRLG